MIYKHFALRMFLRVFLLTTALLAEVFIWQYSGLYAVKVLLAIVSIALFIEVCRYATRTNSELNRFLGAIRYDDFSQRFDEHDKGAGFDQLSQTFNDIMDEIKQSRHDQEEKLRHLKALTEHIPVPLISLFPNGRIQLHNNAARRLLGGSFVDRKVSRIEDIGELSENLAEALRNIVPGERSLVQFLIDDIERQLTIVATDIVTGTANEKLLSMQDIQSELDEVQLQAWQDLVRVLTHEMMNSITPIASLAKTATDLVDDAAYKLKPQPEFAGELDDVRNAVDTVARRSDSLMHFVQGYRSLTQLPEPKKREISVAKIFTAVSELFTAQWKALAIALTIDLDSEHRRLNADPDLLEQILINLLRNAEQALCEREVSITDRRVMLRGKLTPRGHVLIEVSDSGPGVPDNMQSEIFLPFYTSKRQGSGVGLALTRQIMLAHGGHVSVGTSELGGAKFSLVF